MKPLLQVAAWLTLFALLASPPHDLRIPRGYLTAVQWRAEVAWEVACDRARGAWEALQYSERTKDLPTVVDAIIAGLLERDDSDSAYTAGMALAASYDVWKAERAAKKQSAMEVLTIAA